MNDRKNRVWWYVISAVLFVIVYWLCRFVFFELHGMKSWPNVLLLFGACILLISFIAGKRFLSLTVPVGYLAGFGLAMLFQSEGVDPGGGRTNNAWILWTVIFLVSLLLGIISEIFYKKRVCRK